MDTYESFFKAATGNTPYPYQRRIGEADELPALIDVAPGLGKTAAIVVAWLWRGGHRPDVQTPRRLVLALPTRVLTNQSFAAAQAWLRNLDLTDEVGIHLLVGGMEDTSHPWRLSPGKRQILICTIDMFTSRTLNRGFGQSRGTYPIDAGLLLNDTQTVIDEIQLAPASTTTQRQISAFQRDWPAIRSGLTCMSATVDRTVLSTVDNPSLRDGAVVTLDAEDHQSPGVQKRLSASRAIQELHISPGDAKAFVAAVATHHRGGLTLVIVNTVKFAVEVYKLLKRRKPAIDVPIMLLHSRFRPVDRDRHVRAALASDGDLILVTTQVIEAGADLNGRTLITEAPPWHSLIQRSGRCNRTGSIVDAQLYWTAPKSHPYREEDVEATCLALRRLEGQHVSNADLLGQSVVTTLPQVQVLRRPDFAALFDTAPDLSGNDLDVSPYIRDTDDIDAEVCWVDFADPTPPSDLKVPGAQYRCRVPITELVSAVKRSMELWRFAIDDKKWIRVTPQRPPRPGEILICHASQGRYTTECGFDAGAGTQRVPLADDTTPPEPPGADQQNDSLGADESSLTSRQWYPLELHLTDTRRAAALLTEDLQLDSEVREDLVLAAYLHDLGKSHPVWQNALRATGDGAPADRLWAKSPSSTPLKYGDGIRAFRHELASVALLDGAFADLLAQAHDRDLVRYLIAAHHGKCRVQIRDVAESVDQIFGLRTSKDLRVPPVLGHPETITDIDISPFRSYSEVSSTRAWPEMVDDLLARYGMFRLLHFEALVRIADWQASRLADGTNR